MKRTSNKIIFGGLFLLLVVSMAATGCNPTPTTQPTVAKTTTPTELPTEVVLTMGSWRADDVEQMNHILARFHARYPNITVKFDPIPASQYDAALETQLEGGTAPDLFYLRSYAVSQSLFEGGYLEPLDGLPGLQESFSPDMLAAWSTDDGKPYGVPFIATSHGIYYNVDLFEKLNLKVPTTWEEFLTTAKTIKDAGIIPLANASGSKWTIAEIHKWFLPPYGWGKCVIWITHNEGPPRVV